MLDPSHPIKSHPATASGNAVEEPKPFVPVFFPAIQDVIDASRNLNAETSRQGVIPGIKRHRVGWLGRTQ